jgi:hypothetical protein
METLNTILEIIVFGGAIIGIIAGIAKYRYDNGISKYSPKHH